MWQFEYYASLTQKLVNIKKSVFEFPSIASSDNDYFSSSLPSPPATMTKYRVPFHRLYRQWLSVEFLSFAFSDNDYMFLDIWSFHFLESIIIARRGRRRGLPWSREPGGAEPGDGGRAQGQDLRPQEPLHRHWHGGQGAEQVSKIIYFTHPIWYTHIFYTVIVFS